MSARKLCAGMIGRPCDNDAFRVTEHEMPPSQPGYARDLVEALEFACTECGLIQTLDDLREAAPEPVEP